MKKLLVSVLALGICLGLTGIVMASGSADQSTQLDVGAINELSVDGAVSMVFNATNIEASGGGAYVIGSAAFQVTDTNGTYSVTTNSATAKKITAEIDADLTATGLVLYVTLASASGTSAGELDISDSATTAADVVTALTNCADAAQQITYRAVATVETPVDSTYDPTITYTIVDSA